MDYKKILHAEGIEDLKVLPKETQENIAEYNAIEKSNDKAKVKKLKRLNEVIYHEIIDFLADKDEQAENEYKKSDEYKQKQEAVKEEEKRMEARKAKLVEIGFVEDSGLFSCEGWNIVFDKLLKPVTDEQFEAWIVKAEQKITDLKEKAVHKSVADNFGLF